MYNSDNLMDCLLGVIFNKQTKIIMDSKFYVSLEAARLLKEKGYNNYSIVYDCSVEGDILLNQRPIYGEWAGDKDVYPCPTKAEAIDWLESKGMLIEISIDIDECAWIFNIVDKEKFITIGHPKDGEFFTDRLEAEEAAIIKALELL